MEALKIQVADDGMVSVDFITVQSLPHPDMVKQFDQSRVDQWKENIKYFLDQGYLKPSETTDVQNVYNQLTAMIGFDYYSIGDEESVTDYIEIPNDSDWHL